MRLGLGNSREKKRAQRGHHSASAYAGAGSGQVTAEAGAIAASSAWASPSAMIPDMMPLYDAEQFEGLLQRERARADRAAARPPRELPQRRTEVKKGPGGSKLDPVWGATTDNKEFSLVIFRPRTRSDRSGLVELLQTNVRTTDAVGVIDNRRLGVLLPDTSAQNAVLFVKKVLAGAELASVQLSHVVHTYPASWPDDDSSNWDEPRRSDQSTDGRSGPPESGPSDSEPPSGDSTQVPLQRITRDRRELAAVHSRAGESSMVRNVMNWLQAAAFRRLSRTPLRA